MTDKECQQKIDDRVKLFAEIRADNKFGKLQLMTALENPGTGGHHRARFKCDCGWFIDTMFKNVSHHHITECDKCRQRKENICF